MSLIPGHLLKVAFSTMMNRPQQQQGIPGIDVASSSRPAHVSPDCGRFRALALQSH